MVAACLCSATALGNCKWTSGLEMVKIWKLPAAFAHMEHTILLKMQPLEECTKEASYWERYVKKFLNFEGNIDSFFNYDQEMHIFVCAKKYLYTLGVYINIIDI